MAPVLAWAEHGGDETPPGAAPLLLLATRTLLRLGRTASTTVAGALLYGPDEEYAHLHPPVGAVVAEEAHRALGDVSEEEEHPLFWLFNTTVLLLAVGAVGTTCYYVNRHGCMGIYGTWHDSAPGLRESDLAFARIVLERQRAKEALTKDPPEVREKKLRKWLGHRDCHMTVDETDICPPGGRGGGDNRSKEEAKVGGSYVEKHDCIDEEAPSPLALQTADEAATTPDEPPSEFSEPDVLDECDMGALLLSGSDPKASVANCCAICLCPYEVGDHVVWSRTRVPMKKEEQPCPHAFHMECILEWLVRQYDENNESTSCPCCRRDFIDKAIILADEESRNDEKSKRKSRWGTIAVDPRVIAVPR